MNLCYGEVYLKRAYWVFDAPDVIVEETAEKAGHEVDQDFKRGLIELEGIIED